MRIAVRGVGAVSPAGWGREALWQAAMSGVPIAPKPFANHAHQLRARFVPPPLKKPEFLAHARLRRSSPISHYVVAAALEALGSDAAKVQQGKVRLGIILCATCGCVNYSRRFYDEVLKQPATASPLLFPETVFNAPASHLAALLGTTEIVYTIVGEPGNFLAGMAMAGNWMREERVDRCLVIGAEEADWLTAGAARLFDKQLVMGEGAGAIYLSPVSESTTRIAGNNESGSAMGVGAHAVEMIAVSDPYPLRAASPRERAAISALSSICSGTGNDLLCDGLSGASRTDRAEATVAQTWPGPRMSVKAALGEALAAGAAWQCVCAVEAIARDQSESVVVNISSANRYNAIAARFARFGAPQVP